MTAENKWAVTCPVCRNRYKWSGPLSPIPPCPLCVEAKAVKVLADKRLEQPAAAEDVADALSLAEQIESLASELPEAGSEFGESVTEKAADIAANIRHNNRVTVGQMNALSNILEGVERWFGE